MSRSDAVSRGRLCKFYIHLRRGIRKLFERLATHFALSSRLDYLLRLSRVYNRDDTAARNSLNYSNEIANVFRISLGGEIEK